MGGTVIPDAGGVPADQNKPAETGDAAQTEAPEAPAPTPEAVAKALEFVEKVDIDSSSTLGG